jgi:transposase
MANQLRMALKQAVEALWGRGWSRRKISRELGIHRDTVARHVARIIENRPPPGNATAGKSAPKPPGNAVFENPEDSKQATPPAKATPGIFSCCEPFRDWIIEKIDQDLSAQRIFQDLVTEKKFTGSYSSVKRFVRRHRSGVPLPFRRMEWPPGQRAQVDFGRAAPVVDSDGKMRRPWFLRVVLEHSRKGYTEAVYRQTTENFIRCLENAFWAMGGVPEIISLDNMKAAVKKADWFDPDLNPKVRDFAKHYGTAFLPIKPGVARHNGKVESSVGYTKNNALKGRRFSSITEENDYLADWERQVADKRIHGTTRKQVIRQFEEVERPVLKPLPRDRFPSFHEGPRKVNRDGHVEVQRSYYSAPPEYVSRQVWVRYDNRTVRVFSERMELVATHVRREPGRFSTSPTHIDPRKISALEKGAGFLISKASEIGDQAGVWAKSVIEQRGVQGMRTVLGLSGLEKKYGSARVDQACALALTHGSMNLGAIRELVGNPTEQQRLEFAREHPLIRDLDEYGKLARVSFSKEDAREDGNGTDAQKAQALRHGQDARRENPGSEEQPIGS